MKEPSGATGRMSNVSIARRAWNIRRKALLMGEVQGQGYVGQALGVADVLAASYFHALNYRPEDPEWEGRDRFLLSIGHYAIALYAVLMEAGVIPEEEIETYGMDDRWMPMSGMASYTPGMEITGGSLGHGLGIAVSMALGAKRKTSDALNRSRGAGVPRWVRYSSGSTCRRYWTPSVRAVGLVARHKKPRERRPCSPQLCAHYSRRQQVCSSCRSPRSLPLRRTGRPAPSQSSFRFPPAGRSKPSSA
jgi:hypothetical protein